MSDNEEVKVEQSAPSVQSLPEEPTQEDYIAPDEPSPEDKATYDFQQLLPRYKKAVKYLGKASAQRVLHALIEYPLEVQQPKFLSNEEKVAFYYGVQLLDVRHVIWNALLKLQADKNAAEKAEKVVVNE